MTLHDFAGQAIYQETTSFLLNASDSIAVLMFDISIGLHMKIEFLIGFLLSPLVFQELYYLLLLLV